MKQHHSIDLLFSLSLFMVFVICSFMVLLFQINGYHRIINKSEEHQQMHIPLAYIQTQIRSHDEHNAISVFNQEDANGIRIVDEQSNSVLYIYEYHNKLMELTMYKGVKADFAAGTPMFDIKEFHVSKHQQAFTITLKDKTNHEATLIVALQSR